MDTEHSSNAPAIYNGCDHIDQWQNRGHISSEDPMDMDSTEIGISPFSSAMPSIPKPPQELPQRCQSEPIDHRAHLNAQVDELLEDWPRRMSCSPVNTQDWQSLCKKLQPRVTFSERSSMHIYRPDPRYGRNKSYTKEDRKNFGSEAFSEAIRIKRLVLSTPGASTKDSFKYLLKHNIISLEEIVGIEHLVLGKSASKLLKERQDHSRAVLMEQERQCVQEKIQEHVDPMKKLGEFSASRSLKSVKRARIRAAMAA